MESVQAISPMMWMILVAAAVISIAVLFNKAVKFALKLAVIAVMAVFVIYFLVQAGIIPPPTLPEGN